MGSRSSSPRRTSTEHPEHTETDHDLNDGDLEIGPLDVSRSDSLLIALQSQDNANFSVSVEWRDSNGKVYQQESATDISLSSVSEGWARLTRKGPQAKVIITDESGGENVVNAFVDTEP